MIERAQIASMIPHAGSMCLLERVIRWDAQAIHCMASSHRAPRHPLADGGQLHSACGVEYAAQAIAVHGALLGAADARPRSGYLVSVRGLVLAVERLDNVPGALSIKAERLAGEETHMSYRFAVRGAGRVLLHGRMAVVLELGSS